MDRDYGEEATQEINPKSLFISIQLIPVFLPRVAWTEGPGRLLRGAAQMQKTELLALSNTGNVGKGILHNNC